MAIQQDDKNPVQPQGTQATNPQGGMSTQGELGSPISNEAYNVLTALQAKLEGLEAYRTYACDGQQQVWTQLSNQERQGVLLLVGELERLVKDGKLRCDTSQRPKAKS